MIEFPIDWQTCVALLIVAGAIFALIRRCFGIGSKSGTGCSSCSGCANRDPGSPIDGIELFQLEKGSPK